MVSALSWELFFLLGAQEQVSYWPEEERRRCAAIIERGSGSGDGSRHSDDGGGGGGGGLDILCTATGLPIAEITRFGVPLSDTALMKIYPRKKLSPSFWVHG